MPLFEVEVREVVRLMVEVEAADRRDAYRVAKTGPWRWQGEAGQDVESVVPVRGSARELSEEESYAA